MTVYRFANYKYASDISGTGAKIFGGRWNFEGWPVLYTSEHISLGLLEILANTDSITKLQEMRLVEIKIPETEIHVIQCSELKRHWWNDIEYTQWIGTELLRINEHLIIKCPSAIVTREHNYLVNPIHSSFNKIKVNGINDFNFDSRIFKNQSPF